MQKPWPPHPRRVTRLRFKHWLLNRTFPLRQRLIHWRQCNGIHTKVQYHPGTTTWCSCDCLQCNPF